MAMIYWCKIHMTPSKATITSIFCPFLHQNTWQLLTRQIFRNIRGHFDQDITGEVSFVPMNVRRCHWKGQRNNIKSDFPSSTFTNRVTFTITSSYMHFFLPIGTTCIHMSTMSSQFWFLFDWFEDIPPEAECQMIYSCPDARFIKTHTIC